MSLSPFTVEHFRAWTAGLRLDNGQDWQLEPFQAAFVADVFAGFREAWLVVPEGNTKTTTVAGLALYHCEFTPDAWVPVGAASRDQARIVYRQASGFVRRTPRLAAMFRTYDGYRRIHHRENGAQIEIFAADADTADGVIPTLCLIDEPHRQRDLSLYLTWAGKLDKRGGQIVAISTAGEPGGEFEETRQRMRHEAREVTRRGAFGRYASESAVLHEWAVPEGGDVEDIATVKAANPFSGITEEGLARKFSSPTMTLGHWRRFVCNVPTRSEYAAIQEAEWFAAQVPDDIPPGEGSWLGVDIGWKWDTSAAVPLWIRDEEFRLLGRSEVIVPPRDGSTTDPEDIKAALVRLHERYGYHTAVMDMHRAEDIAHWMQRELEVEVIDWPQTIPAQVGEYNAFMEALRNGWLKHTGDPMLTRHALNAIARVQRGGDAIFERPVQSRRNRDEQDRRVIDALKAAAMAHRVAMLNHKPKPLRRPRRLVTM